jgi:hypothetical protein
MESSFCFLGYALGSEKRVWELDQLEGASRFWWFGWFQK